MHRVFDRQLVQAEFMLHLGQLFGCGVLQGDPHKRVGPGDVVADLSDRNIGEFGAVAIGDAVDEHLGDFRWVARCKSFWH
jgi:hypothetical protein